MILQTAPKLIPPWHKFGCYVLDIANFANKYKGIEHTYGSLNTAFHRLVEKEAIDTDMYINDPEAVFYHFGMEVVYTDRHESPDYLCNPDEIEILLFTLPRSGGTWRHFVCGNGSGVVTFDPWGVSKCVEEGTLESKRIFKRI